MLWIFHELIDKYDIAIGYEGSTLDNDHTDYVFKTAKPYKLDKLPYYDGELPIKEHWFTINADNERLEDVMDKIVEQMKNYKWEINDDVINIIPTKGRDKRYQALLELNIGNFMLEKDKEIAFIRRRVFDLPEVKSFLIENNILTTKTRSFGLYTQRKLEAELNFSNLTFRELLNKITKAKRGGWILRKHYGYGEEKDFIEIDI